MSELPTCDACNREIQLDEPVTLFSHCEFTIYHSLEPGGLTYDTNAWALCDGCAPALSAGDVPALLALAKPTSPATMTLLATVYRALFYALSGAPLRVTGAELLKRYPRPETAEA